jgi:hypothetical protein
MASLPRRLCGDRVDFPPLHFVTLIIFRAASREIHFLGYGTPETRHWISPRDRRPGPRH